MMGGDNLNSIYYTDIKNKLKNIYQYGNDT